jgi:hypothetical protein
MKKKSNSTTQRRKFLSLGLLGGAALVSNPASAMLSLDTDNDTVPMLTPDGKVVGVSKRTLAKIQDKRKATDTDYHTWGNTPHKTDPES